MNRSQQWDEGLKEVRLTTVEGLLIDILKTLEEIKAVLEAPKGRQDG